MKRLCFVALLLGAGTALSCKDTGTTFTFDATASQGTDGPKTDAGSTDAGAKDVADAVAPVDGRDASASNDAGADVHVSTDTADAVSSTDAADAVSSTDTADAVSGTDAADAVSSTDAPDAAGSTDTADANDVGG